MTTLLNMHTQSLERQLCQSLVIVSVFLMAMSCLSVSKAWSAELPSEPSESFLVNEDVNIVTGLYTREYSLTGTDVIDYKTARQIILSEYNEYWNSVVETKEFPLFYWHDANHDGHFAMWVDQTGEGCTCNIVPYVWNPDESQTSTNAIFR